MLYLSRLLAEGRSCFACSAQQFIQACRQLLVTAQTGMKNLPKHFEEILHRDKRTYAYDLWLECTDACASGAGAALANPDVAAAAPSAHPQVVFDMSASDEFHNDLADEKSCERYALLRKLVPSLPVGQAAAFGGSVSCCTRGG